MIKFPHVLPVVKALYDGSSSTSGPNEKPRTFKHQTLRKQRSLEIRRNNFVAPITRCLSEDATTAFQITDIDHNINCINTSIKIVNSAKMYEPVLAGDTTCVTILTRFNDHANADYPTVASTATANQSEDDDENECRPKGEKEIKNADNHKSKANVAPIPEKPPRRIKLQKLRQPIVEHREPTPKATPEKIKETKMKMNEDHHNHRVDIEDINRLSIDTEIMNYKNKCMSVGVQASPLPPFRLRVLPKSMRKVKSDTEKCECGKDRAAICCTVIGRWIFSQCGLTVIIVIWALLGAAAFFETEGPREREQAEELATLQYNLAIGLATELRQVVPHEPVWLSMVQNYFAKHETLLLDAVSSGYGEGGGGGHIWTYPGCLLFAVSLLTTLGFGAPVPRTTLGRGAAVLFSAIGIPLHFLLVLNIGVLIASKIQAFAIKRSNIQTNSPSANSMTSNTAYQLLNQPRWLKWLPVATIAFYYTLGVILFGFVRRRNVADCLLFPLDFTATGGVAKTLGHVRIFYALYLEVAVTLAATMVSLLQYSASRGIVNFGLKLGILTNT